MKTATLTTLVLFAAACAPEAGTMTDDALTMDMEASTEAAVDKVLPGTDDAIARLVARTTLRTLAKKYRDMDCRFVGTMSGSWHDRMGHFKGTGFGIFGDPLFEMSGELNQDETTPARREIEGFFTAVDYREEELDRPEKGDFFGAVDGESYSAVQLADGYTPLVHEGAWISASKLEGGGFFVGLISDCD